MRYVIDPNYFRDALLEIGQHYKFYTRNKVTVNDYGEIENTYRKAYVWGSLQPEQNSRDSQGAAGSVEQLYNFYCESKYRIYIDDIIVTENDELLHVYEYKDWDPYGVRELKCRALSISEARNLREFEQFVKLEKGGM